MARRGVGRREELWRHHKYGVEVEIRFISDSGKFFADMGEKRIESVSLPEVREQLKKLVEEQVEIVWIPVLEAHASANVQANAQRSHGRGSFSIEKAEYADEADDGSASVALEYNRYWVAWVGAKWMICKDWTALDKPVEGEKFSPFLRTQRMRAWEEKWLKKGPELQLPYVQEDVDTWTRREVFVPYSQALWDSLVVISTKMEDLSDKINDLLATEEGRTKLETAMSGLLLPAPKGEDEEG